MICCIKGQIRVVCTAAAQSRTEYNGMLLLGWKVEDLGPADEKAKHENKNIHIMCMIVDDIELCI